MKDDIKKRIEAVRRGEVPEGYQRVDGYIIPEDWHLEPFSKKFDRSVRKNASLCDNVLTISAQLGLVSQKEYYDKDIASEDKSGYFLLQRGEFAYNKSYSTGYPYGAIKRLEKYERGIVSPLYICFAPKKGTNAAFFAQYFEAGLYNREIYRFAQEGARNHGLLNIANGDFFAGALIVPTEREQAQIAEILSVCDQVIDLKQKRVEELKILKKTCLAKMFPREGSNMPEVRFPGFNDPWEQRKLNQIADIIGGGTPSTTNSEYWDGEIDWYAPAEIGGQIYADGSVRKITELGLQKSSATVLPANRTILFTSRAGIGKTAILRRPGATNQGFQSIVLRDGFNPYFIFSMSDSIKGKAEAVASGSTFLEISGKALGNLDIMLPNKREQDQIAGCFEALDTLITLHQRELEAEQQKKKALMQLLLTGLVRVNA